MDWLTKDDCAVIDRWNSHLHESAVKILPEALRKVRAGNRPFLVEEVKFDHVVGNTTCVRTTDADEILYAKREGRRGHSRFVKGREAEPSSSVVLILKRRNEGGYVLITAYVGSRAEPEPWDPKSNLDSQIFWASHALIWGSETVVGGTETTSSPWS